MGTRKKESGTIVKIVADKGFGFIKMPGRPKDVFFHVRALPPNTDFSDRLLQRQVTFEIEDTDKGPRAVDVDLV